MSMFYSLPNVLLKDLSPDVLGGKGYNLVRMAREGIPVPPAFIIPTSYCVEYMQDPEKVMAQVSKEVMGAYYQLSELAGYDPLVSIRSGAKFSMPGMMDTILNVGLLPEDFSKWEERLGPDCALDCVERLSKMYKSVVGVDVPTKDIKSQLLGAIEAVFKSWNNERAKTYRRIHNIPESLGTAVIMQAMVFGNLNEKSCTGVLFTRDPSSGAKNIVGEFLPNAQGEDVVAGEVTPKKLPELYKFNKAIHNQLFDIANHLEALNKDMQDIEFTVQDGKLFILQTRNGKRTPQAALKIALDMLKEGLIGIPDLIERVTYEQYIQASKARIQDAFKKEVPADAVGIAGSSGCVIGKAVFSSEAAVQSKEPCILVTKETNPDDIAGMYASKGLLTAIGGYTSHAAVVARGAGIAAVVGCDALSIEKDSVSLGSKGISEGDLIALDGDSGEVWVRKEVPIENGDSTLADTFANLLLNHYGIFKACGDQKDVAGAKKVIISVAEVQNSLGEHFEETTIREAVHAMVEAAIQQDSEVVLDFRSRGVFLNDVKVESFCQEQRAPDVYASCILEKLEKHASKVMVLGFGVSKASAIEKKGFHVIKSVQSISDLITAQGLCAPDYDALDQTSSKADIMALCKLKERAGEKIKSFNIVYEVDAEAVSRGVVFACGQYPFMASVLK